MGFRGILAVLGAAAALSSVPGAADAASPDVAEPSSHLRPCDLHGAGFFSLPGTGTCLGLRGYVRFDMGFLLTSPRSFGTFVRFAPKLDARTETEWGVLRSYGEIEFDTVAGAAPTVRLLDAYVELAGLRGTLRVGKSDTPYTRVLGHGGLNLVDTGNYSNVNGAGFSYVLDAGNGFSAIAAAFDGRADMRAHAMGPGTMFEAGARFERDRGAVGAIAGYDGVTGKWGATAALTARFGRTSFKLQGFYSSDAGTGPVAAAHAIRSPSWAFSRWSVLGSVATELTERTGAALTAQWFDTGNEWLAQGELQFRPDPNLAIVPAIRYTSPGGGTWSALLRFERFM